MLDCVAAEVLRRGVEGLSIWSLQPERAGSEVLAATTADLSAGLVRHGPDAALREVVGWCRDGEPSRAAAHPVAASLAARADSDVLVPLAGVDRQLGAPHHKRSEPGILALHGVT